MALNRYLKVGVEIVFLLLIALVLGFTYNSVTSSGLAIFSPHPKLRNGADVFEPTQIDLKEAFSLFSSGAVFLDAREPDEYYLGHIYGSKNLPYEELDKYSSILDSLPKDIVVVTYCDGQGCDLSIHLAQELLKRGFRKVYAFYAGWNAWTNVDYPVDVGQ